MEEETEKKELLNILETLTTKIDELTKAVKEEKTLTKEEIEETSKEEKNLLERLTNKIDELTKVINEKKVIAAEKIKENPLACTMGAFVGGLFVGLLFGKGKEGKKQCNGK